MLHEVYQASAEATRVEELKANADETGRLNTMLLETLDLSATTKKRKGFFKKFLQGKADCYLTPEQTQKLGLVDHIGVPTFRTTVSVEMTLELESDEPSDA